MAAMTEYTESTPNLKTVRDQQGQLWLCEASVSADSSLSGQGCVRADDIVYDRNFGG